MNKLYDLYLYSCEDWGEEVFKAASIKEAEQYIKPKVDADSYKFSKKKLKLLTKERIQNIRNNYKLLFKQR